MAYPKSYDPNDKPMTPGPGKTPPGFKPPHIHSSRGGSGTNYDMARRYGRHTKNLISSGDAFDTPSPSMVAESAHTAAHYAMRSRVMRRMTKEREDISIGSNSAKLKIAAGRASAASNAAYATAHLASRARKRAMAGGGGGEVTVRAYTRSKPSR